MKKVLTALFLTLTLSLSGTTFYVATNGKDSNPGTITQPFATWDYAFNLVVAGDIVYIRGGNYYPAGKLYQGSYYGVRVYNRNGTSENSIKILAYPGETPVLDCSAVGSSSGWNYGIFLSSCTYWDIKGITVINVHENSNNSESSDGWAMANCSYFTLERCVVRDCSNGFTLGGSSNDYIYYTNCDAYQLHDHHDNGDLANGFNTNIGTGDHVFYEGCRAWLCSDDGFDAYGGNGYISYNNCWSFENGSWGGMTGNGAGIKTGASSGLAESGVQRLITNCLVFNNSGYGFDESQDGRTGILHNIYNNTSFRNNTGFNFWEGGKTDIIKNNISYDERLNSVNFGQNTVDYNSWQDGISISDADFVGLDSDQAKGLRQADGKLPVMTFLHLSSGSDLIDAGIDVGRSFSGRKPDLGAFEFQVAPIGPIPVLISAVVENITPSNLEMTYDLILDSLIIPVYTSYNVLVNNLSRSVNSVSISGSKITLVLGSPIKFGDIVSVSYTKPFTNPLQSVSGREAESISNKPVNNKCIDPSKLNDPPVAVIPYEENIYSGFVYELNATGSYDLNHEPLTYEWIVPNNVPVSSVNGPKIKFLSPVVITAQAIDFQLKVSDGKNIVTKSISINILPYKPELNIARMVVTKASSYQSTDYPNNVSDGSILTKWSSVGDNQWLFLQLAEPFKISYLEIAFLPGQKYSSYFDIYASNDNIVWEPILISSVSCNFSGNLQVFDFPFLKINTEYSYLKLFGHGNSLNTLNIISEFKIFGKRQQNSTPDKAEERNAIIYPNPAIDFFNIFIEDPELNPDIIRLIDFSGKIVLEDKLEPGFIYVQIPTYLNTGIYIVELKSGSITLFAQKLFINR